MTRDARDWPELPFESWRPTLETFHRWTQIVGKVRLTQSPWQNHCWQCTLYVTPRGLTTAAIPHGPRAFRIDFDLIAHELIVQASDGAVFNMPLAPQSVAEFYAQLMDALERMGLPVRIHGRPNEIADATPFRSDEAHRSYDASAVHRFWRILVQSDRVFRTFRGSYYGKSSPSHFFWGALDLATTRFSGRRAPTHPGGVPNLPDEVTRDAYSHEVSSAGFWPGSPQLAYPAYYAYAYPEPAGFGAADVSPGDAFYSADLHEFILPYETVRSSADPDRTLLAFLQSTYEAAASLGGWDRQALDVPPSGWGGRDD